jgi:hypothetical protein
MSQINVLAGAALNFNEFRRLMLIILMVQGILGEGDARIQSDLARK